MPDHLRTIGSYQHAAAELGWRMLTPRGKARSFMVIMQAKREHENATVRIDVRGTGRTPADAAGNARLAAAAMTDGTGLTLELTR